MKETYGRQKEYHQREKRKLKKEVHNYNLFEKWSSSPQNKETEKPGHNYNLFEKWAVGAERRQGKPLGVLRWSGNIFVSPKVSCGQQRREESL